jgi:TctA family transporter
VDLSLVILVAFFSLVGSGLGAITGVLPGIHVNTLALLLVSSSPMVLPPLAQAAALFGAPEGAAPLLLVAVIVAAAVAHSFLDFLPSIFLGAPDEDESLAVLPGHRLLLAGQGRDAVACAAGGGLVGASVAVAMCLPLSLVLGPPLNQYPLLDSVTPVVVVAAIIMLVRSEKGTGKRAEIRVGRATRCQGTVDLVRQVPVDGLEARVCGIAEKEGMATWLVTPVGRWCLRGRVPLGRVRVEGTWLVRRSSRRERAAAASLLAVSGLLGLTCTQAQLPLSPLWSGMGQSIMFPLLTGLFGLPALLSSLGSGPVPPQEEPSSSPDVGAGALGALSGALVGWFPGISSTTGVIIGSAFQKGDGDSLASSRRYLAMVSAVGTSSTALGLLALAVAFKGRSGAMMAAKEVVGAENASLLAPPSPWLPLLLVSVLIASAASYFLALRLGRWLASKASGADMGRMNCMIAVVLVALAALFCGLPGLEVLAVSALLGSVPPKLGVSRVHLTGCLLLPALLYLSGAEEAVLALL